MYIRADRSKNHIKANESKRFQRNSHAILTSCLKINLFQKNNNDDIHVNCNGVHKCNQPIRNGYRTNSELQQVRNSRFETKSREELFLESRFSFRSIVAYSVQL